jgi:imidazolonepropionase-like amidohydrolase
MALHVRGVVLPAAERRDLWLVGDRITFTRPAGGHDTIADGGWVVPGLVDMHSHPGHRADYGYDEAVLLAQGREQAAQGITAVRVPGIAGTVSQAALDDPNLPRLYLAGPWLAWRGLHSADSGTHIQVEDLPAAAAAQARVTGGWCKLIGDWELSGPPVPLDTLRAAVDAVHAAGGRVAVHCQTTDGCRNAVEAGTDTLEHGMHLDHALLDRMARQGTALTPTIMAFASHVDLVRGKPDGPRKDWYLTGFEGLLPTVRAARDAGVAVFAGTDAIGPTLGRFGDVTTEVAWLTRAMPPEAALAASSWLPRTYLGLQGIEEGAPADMVVYDADPRANPAEVLCHPYRVVLRGRVIR